MSVVAVEVVSVVVDVAVGILQPSVFPPVEDVCPSWLEFYQSHFFPFRGFPQKMRSDGLKLVVVSRRRRATS